MSGMVIPGGGISLHRDGGEWSASYGRYYAGSLSPYAFATGCPVLVWAIVLSIRCDIFGTKGAYHPMDSLRYARCLRVCSAKSGTNVAYGASCLCACYAISGTDIAYVVLSAYAKSGTGNLHDTICLTRDSVLTQPTGDRLGAMQWLWEVCTAMRLRLLYALSSTELLYCRGLPYPLSCT
eukprot:1737306-Rhodomonas_salina.3